MSEGREVIKLVGIKKRFGGVVALRNVDFSVFQGEVHGLVGENGSGKSTLVKIATGTIQPDEGDIYIEGQKISRSNPYLSFHKGIRVVHQDLSLFPNLSVAENIFVHEYINNQFRFVPWSMMKKKAREVLERLGVNLDPNESVGRLSFADQQLVAIARAIATNAKLMILDEPTASLTSREVRRLFDIILDLRNQGVAFVFISHRLDEVLDISDRITVLRDGVKTGTFNKQELTKAKLSSLMTGRGITTSSPTELYSEKPEVLRVDNLTRYGEYYNVSFNLHAGEILGLIGPRGAGRTELALTLFGINKPDEGKILVHGKEVVFHSNRDAIRHGVGYLPENRLIQGLVLDQPIADNITLTVLRSFVNRLGFLNRSRKLSVSEKAALDLGIKTQGVQFPVRSLSGGNQQKVVLARWILAAPRILILDTPTHGVDVGAKENIYEIIRKLSHENLSILLISDEEEEVLRVCHRILVMRDGRIIRQYLSHEVNEEKIRRDILGLEGSS